MVSDELWHQDYDLAFALHLEAAESQYLCGNYAASEQQFAVLLRRAASNLDKAKVYRLRSLQYENMSRYARRAGDGPGMPQALRRVVSGHRGGASGGARGGDGRHPIACWDSAPSPRWPISRS